MNAWTAFGRSGAIHFSINVMVVTAVQRRMGEDAASGKERPTCNATKERHHDD
jgi:hypothetical protein